MAKLSRTEKYKDLRESLQNDTGIDSTVTDSQELSRFSRRLNQIDSNNFAATRDYEANDRSGEHARNTTSYEPVTPVPEAEEDRLRTFDTGSFQRSENFTPTFDNDYLDQYIREVKEYNIAQGNAVSENTSVNVLNDLKNSQNNRGTRSSNRPYPRNSTSSSRQTQVPYSSRTPEVSKAYENTADIPFTTSSKRNNRNSSSRNTEEKTENNDNNNLTKEDIMAEVQSMVNGNNSSRRSRQNESSSTQSNTFDTDPFNHDYDSDRSTRQQLLNETTQMRAQLDDYEDNLSEVSDKMRHTNNILNIVLIVLIVALVVILGIVIYIITIARG